MVSKEGYPMEDAGGPFAKASIWYEAIVRGPEETGIRLFSIEADGKKTLFEVVYRFEKNEDDFYVVISNFGIFDRSLAGSKTLKAQAKFSSQAAESAKRRLVEFFAGPEDKPFMPFKMPKGNLLGVDFTKNWINEE